jgi:hypothetical protein
VRELTTPEVVDRLVTELGRKAKHPVDAFFTGGVTAILLRSAAPSRRR